MPLRPFDTTDLDTTDLDTWTPPWHGANPLTRNAPTGKRYRGLATMSARAGSCISNSEHHLRTIQRDGLGMAQGWQMTFLTPDPKCPTARS